MQINAGIHHIAANHTSAFHTSINEGASPAPEAPADDAVEPASTPQPSSKSTEQVADPQGVDGAASVERVTRGETPVADDVAKAEAQAEQIAQERADAVVISQLKARDREVRVHEAAHAAVGGKYAGSPSLQYTRGPDGVNYATSGEVRISTGKVEGDPQATIEKARVVRAAALAPANPSVQDRRVAAQASQLEANARVELREVKREEARIEADVKEDSDVAAESEGSDKPARIGGEANDNPPGQPDSAKEGAVTTADGSRSDSAERIAQTLSNVEGIDNDSPDNPPRFYQIA